MSDTAVAAVVVGVDVISAVTGVAPEAALVVFPLLFFGVGSMTEGDAVTELTPEAVLTSSALARRRVETPEVVVTISLFFM
jgi:hypothetical protein